MRKTFCEVNLKNLKSNIEKIITYRTRKENAGGCAARNMGLSLVTGEYFTIIDGDDWVDTDNLIEFVDFLENNDSDSSEQQKTVKTRKKLVLKNKPENKPKT